MLQLLKTYSRSFLAERRSEEMSFLNIKNVKLEGISAGVPKNISPAISTTDKYGAEDFVVEHGNSQKHVHLTFLHPFQK